MLEGYEEIMEGYRCSHSSMTTGGLLGSLVIELVAVKRLERKNVMSIITPTQAK